MVFEVMGPNVLALIKQYEFKGVPEDYVRKVAFCHDVVPSLARLPVRILTRLSLIAERLYTAAFGFSSRPPR